MSQVKQAHWNVEGLGLLAAPQAVRQVAERASQWVDEFADRITALGGCATGCVRMAAASSTLPEFPTEITESMDYVQADAERLAAFTDSARAAIDQAGKLDDAATADLFTGGLSLRTSTPTYSRPTSRASGPTHQCNSPLGDGREVSTVTPRDDGTSCRGVDGATQCRHRQSRTTEGQDHGDHRRRSRGFSSPPWS